MVGEVLDRLVTFVTFAGLFAAGCGVFGWWIGRLVDVRLEQERHRDDRVLIGEIEGILREADDVS